MVSIAAAAAFFTASGAAAQSCPTSGAGTTCFGGQLYCASSGQCYNQPSCGSNQVMDCSACGCVCNTSLYPCGGCTAASSTAGASCSSPTGGQYVNQCGTCACPSGTTLCPSSNSCIANRSCPAGTTWDPCTDTCGTPNVLLSPGFTQNGYINIAGDINERAGNLRLDYSPAAGQGDLYMANGKALRVDGSGVTNLNVANYGSGGTGLNVNFPAGSQLCFGGACRNSWPSTTDFNPTYVNAAGDTMTGDLSLTGAGTDLFVAGNVGIGTTTPVDGRLEIVRPSTSYRGNMILGTGTSNDWEIGELNADSSFSVKRITSQPVTGAVDLFIDTADNVGIGTTTPGAKLDVFGTAKVLGLQLSTGAGAGKVLTSDASGVGTWQTPTGVTGSGTANALAKFTGATTLGNSRVTDDGTTVVIAPSSPSRVAVGLNAAAGQDGAIAIGLRANASGYYSTAIGQDSSASNSAAIAMGGGSPVASGFMSTAIGSYVTASGNMSAVFGSGVSTSSPLVNATGNSLAVGFNSTVPTLFVGPSSGVGTFGNVGIGTASPTQRLDVSGNVNVAGNAALGGYGISVANNGQGGAIYASTNSTLNGIAALRVINSGAGAGLDVDGGSAGNGAFIKGAGSNVALEVANYNYPGASAVGTVMQVRRGTGSGVAPAAGMGVQIGFPLQSDSAGSFSQGGGLGSVISSVSPWKTDLFFSTVSGSTMSEKMRVTGDGRLGIGTSAPDRSVTVSNAAGANYMNVKDGTHELLMGVDANGGIVSVMTNHDLSFRAGSNSEKMRILAGGNVGIGATAPAAKLAVGGNGVNVYSTDLWVENNLHVQGNEAMAQGGGRGRLRVGTAWGYPGMYAESASNGTATDLVLGASSDHVLINAGSFGRPGGSATFELWGSRISDTGSGVLSLKSGGGVVAFDGGDSVGIGTASPSQKLQVVGGGAYGLGVVCGNSQCFHFNNNGWIYAGDTSGSVYGGVGVAAANIWADSTVYIGGVGRSSWPSLSTTTAYCTFAAGSGAGWKACTCPSGYSVTGWYGYNCKSNGGEWECSSSGPYGSNAVQIYHDSAGTAYVWAQCARVN